MVDLDTLALNCIVAGDSSPDHKFTVHIPASANIATLKEVIKNAKLPRFDKIPADQLQLWNVSISTDQTDERLKADVGNIMANREPQLSAITTLSAVFPSIAEDHLHVLVCGEYHLPFVLICLHSLSTAPLEYPLLLTRPPTLGKRNASCIILIP